MTEAKIKEQVGAHFFGALASRLGYQVTTLSVDEGVDALLQSPSHYFGKTGLRHLWSGYSISVQMKATTQKQVKFEGDVLKYDLKRDNFNDLIYRRDLRKGAMNTSMPLILVLLVLPLEPKNWIELNPEHSHYCLNGDFYWFYPDDVLGFTKSVSTQRISIPVKNRIDLEFFQNIFNLFFKTTN